MRAQSKERRQSKSIWQLFREECERELVERCLKADEQRGPPKRAWWDISPHMEKKAEESRKRQEEEKRQREEVASVVESLIVRLENEQEEEWKRQREEMREDARKRIEEDLQCDEVMSVMESLILQVENPQRLEQERPEKDPRLAPLLATHCRPPDGLVDYVKWFKDGVYRNDAPKLHAYMTKKRIVSHGHGYALRYESLCWRPECQMPTGNKCFLTQRACHAVWELCPKCREEEQQQQEKDTQLYERIQFEVQEQLDSKTHETKRLSSELVKTLSAMASLSRKTIEQRDQNRQLHDYIHTYLKYADLAYVKRRQQQERDYAYSLADQWRKMYMGVTITMEFPTGESKKPGDKRERRADIILELGEHVAIGEIKMDTNEFCEAAGQVALKYAHYLTRHDAKFVAAKARKTLTLFVACPEEPRQRDQVAAREELGVLCHYPGQPVPWPVVPST